MTQTPRPPRPANAFEEHRLDPREPLALPLQLGGGVVAMTRDISASGLYFQVEGQHDMRGPVDFELQLPEARMKFTSVGEVVRVEHAAGRTGVALRLLSPRLEWVEGAD
jgi:PilZ domain